MTDEKIETRKKLDSEERHEYGMLLRSRAIAHGKGKSIKRRVFKKWMTRLDKSMESGIACAHKWLPSKVVRSHSLLSDFIFWHCIKCGCGATCVDESEVSPILAKEYPDKVRKEED